MSEPSSADEKEVQDSWTHASPEALRHAIRDLLRRTEKTPSRRALFLSLVELFQAAEYVLEHAPNMGDAARRRLTLAVTTAEHVLGL